MSEIETTSSDNKCTAEDWYTRLHGGEVDGSVLQAFQCWLDEDPLHQQEYEQCELTMALMGEISDTPELTAFIDEAEALIAKKTAVKKTIAKTAIAKTTVLSRLLGPLASESNTWFGLTKPVAICGTFLLAVLLIFLPLRNSVNGLDEATHLTAIGASKRIALSDGSLVALNTASELKVDYQPEVRQLVLSKGEANFSVAHNPDRHFDVLAGDKIIRAVGTRFNVRVDDDTTTVIVLEGKIKVLSTDKAQSEKAEIEKGTGQFHASPILIAGNVATYSASDGPVIVGEINDLPSVEAWVDGKLIFKHWSLARAVEEHNRYVEQKIHIKDKALAQMAISGVFATGDTLRFANALQAMLPLTIEERYVDGRSIITLASAGELPDDGESE